MHNGDRDDLAKPAAATAGERVEALDALRGFALLGILLANILYWSGWSLMNEAQRLALAGADGVLWQYRFHHLVVDGKFYTLFSLLFGAGFALQLARIEGRGGNGLAIYRRRVLVLLGIGLIHSCLIWDGDILTLYALMGLILPLFIRWSDARLAITALVLIFVVPFAGVALFDALGWAPYSAMYQLGDAVALALGTRLTPDNSVAVLASGSWDQLAAWLISGPIYTWGTKIESWRIPKVLGIMLLGLIVGRWFATGRLPGDQALLRRTLIAGLVLGLPPTLAYAVLPKQGQADWSSLLGTVPMALAYGAAFLLAWPRARGLLGLFAAPGRMALTNYLSHSIIGIVLFYGVGFGLVGQVRPVGIYAIALAIFAGQVLFSRWWLARYAMGPMERLWRNLTYGRSAQ
jgi:uncharacterized protein